MRNSHATAGSEALEIVSSRMGRLWDGLYGVYDAIGFAEAGEGDEVFRPLVLARMIDPTNKYAAIGCWPTPACRPPPRHPVD